VAGRAPDACGAARSGGLSGLADKAVGAAVSRPPTRSEDGGLETAAPGTPYLYARVVVLIGTLALMALEYGQMLCVVSVSVCACASARPGR